jgi:predicted enzyme related to lactoylglutathione lyase
MSDENTLETGSVGWMDLTVADAPRVRDFYREVAGWKVQDVAMKDDAGEYADFAMLAPGSGRGIAGVCHARGGNSDLPPVWLIYITVENLDASLEKVRAGRGKVLAGPKKLGGQAVYAVIEDPAGAACALFQALNGD